MLYLSALTAALNVAIINQISVYLRPKTFLIYFLFLFSFQQIFNTTSKQYLKNCKMSACCIENCQSILRDTLLKKKTVKKGDIVCTGRGGSTPVPFLSPNLPDSQITQKWTFDTTIWVASPVYALFSVIRQQMSPFDQFRGVSPKGDNVPFFYRFFFQESFP